MGTGYLRGGLCNLVGAILLFETARRCYQFFIQELGYKVARLQAHEDGARSSSQKIKHSSN